MEERRAASTCWFSRSHRRPSRLQVGLPAFRGASTIELSKETGFMKWASAAILGSLLFAQSSGVAQDEWRMDESRPLGKFAARLVHQFGYLVTYEDAPCDEPELRTDVY